MRILFAGDEHPYSAHALKKVIELARHTWADVTLLSVLPAQSSLQGESLPSQDPRVLALRRYREEFLEVLGSSDSPYALERWGHEWVPLRNGSWEEIKVCRGVKKDVKVRIRAGNADTEILNEADKDGSDLIVLGCAKGAQCVWEASAATPRKVAGNAACSVLLVKEDKPIRRILACIDQISVSQESLEMINQLVTIHNAQLELIGLTQDGGAKSEAYTRLIQIGDYYSDKGIPVNTRLAELSKFEAVISTNTGQDLLAFWMGKKSLLTRLFPRDWVERFVGICQTSVLVLR
ncbi:MAG: universal stress protein [Deltaproteobacteria bacterium]|nr:universal stress protein [Deltaproteobacteria bacterium]